MSWLYTQDDPNNVPVPSTSQSAESDSLVDLRSHSFRTGLTDGKCSTPLPIHTCLRDFSLREEENIYKSTNITPFFLSHFWSDTIPGPEEEGGIAPGPVPPEAYFIPDESNNPAPSDLQDCFWVIPIKPDEFDTHTQFTRQHCRLWSTATLFRKVRPMDYKRLSRILNLRLQAPETPAGTTVSTIQYEDFAEQLARACMHNASLCRLFGETPGNPGLKCSHFFDLIGELFVGVSVRPDDPLDQQGTGIVLAYLTEERWNRCFLESPTHEPAVDLPWLNRMLRDAIRDVARSQQQERTHREEKARRRRQRGSGQESSTDTTRSGRAMGSQDTDAPPTQDDTSQRPFEGAACTQYAISCPGLVDES